MRTMRSFIIGFLIRCVQIAGGLFYLVLKCLPTQNKVVFLSRQSDRPSLDIQLVQKELERKDPTVRIVIITKTLKSSLWGVVRFAWYSLASLYHLATARVCVLESYWPAVSLFSHKRSLTVIQMWHALGKIKQSGHQTTDRGYGRSGSLAKQMRMHKGYDVVIAGNPSMNSFYCQSFGIEESKLLNIGLPRLDYLVEEADNNRQRLLSLYPDLAEKTVVLYAPTFRRDTVADYLPTVRKLMAAGYAVVVKPHPNQALKNPELLKPFFCPDMTTMQVLGACDIVITDFSAISFEAAALRKQLYFYLFDRDTYLEKNGINIDMHQEMPKCVYQDLDSLLWNLQNSAYDWAALEQFRHRYLPVPLTGATQRLGQLILDCVRNDKYDAIRKNMLLQADLAVSVDR